MFPKDTIKIKGYIEIRVDFGSDMWNLGVSYEKKALVLIIPPRRRSLPFLQGSKIQLSCEDTFVIFWFDLLGEYGSVTSLKFTTK